jgi:hypothetical protein
VAGIVEPQARAAGELQVGLVDEARGVERMPARQASQVAARETAQLLVHERDEPIERRRIAGLVGLQQARDLGRVFQEAWAPQRWGGTP